MLDASKTLPGRSEAMKLKNEHFVLKNPILPPFPDNMERAIVGTGCFWGTAKPS
jgi:peptide-methionine (S)-S-oxide reductase